MTKLQEARMERPMSVDQIAQRMKALGDQRTLEALRMHVVRAIQGGTLSGAYKVNPDRETSPWLVPIENAEKWLDDAGI